MMPYLVITNLIELFNLLNRGFKFLFYGTSDHSLIFESLLQDLELLFVRFVLSRGL